MIDQMKMNPDLELYYNNENNDVREGQIMIASIIILLQIVSQTREFKTIPCAELFCHLGQCSQRQLIYIYTRIALIFSSFWVDIGLDV